MGSDISVGSGISLWIEEIIDSPSGAAIGECCACDVHRDAIALFARPFVAAESEGHQAEVVVV